MSDDTPPKDMVPTDPDVPMAAPATSDEETDVVRAIVLQTLEEVDGPANFWKAWTPEALQRIVDAMKETALAKSSGQTGLATRRAMIEGVIQAIVLVSIIGAVTYLSATEMLTAAGAGALGTLAGYLMGKKT